MGLDFFKKSMLKFPPFFIPPLLFLSKNLYEY